uniref:Cytochrome c oxidase subunit 7A1, mitochondrial n=1 Tax=Cynoglossus semilaevis TaxID=244447 RepID=A0A3P8WGH6_CYNSE
MNHLLVTTAAFSSSARQMRNRVAEAQKRFQEDNGHPVHLKGGTFDLLMYRVTMTLTIAGNTDPHVPSSSAAPDLIARLSHRRTNRAYNLMAGPRCWRS